MAQFIRMKKFRTYLQDGKSYAEYDTGTKTDVFVALILGNEPLVIKDDSDYLDVDEIILKAADHIKRVRRNERRRVKKKDGGSDQKGKC